MAEEQEHIARDPVAEWLARSAWAAASRSYGGRRSLNVAGVHINAIDGNDANDGLTAETAWKTNARLGQAVGVYGWINPPGTGARWFTIYYEGAVPTDLLNLQAVLAPNACLRMLGTSTMRTLLEGTISAAVPYTNTNVLASIADPAVTSWAPFLGKRITWTGGAALNAQAFIANDLGSHMARVSGPALTFDVVVTGRSVPQPVAPSTGTYRVDDLGTLYVGLFDIQSTSQGDEIEPFVFWIDLNIADVSLIGASTNPSGVSTFYEANGCIIGWREMEGFIFAANVCCFPAGIIANDGMNFTMSACLVTDYALWDAGAIGYLGQWTLGEGTGFCSIAGAYLVAGDFAAENAVPIFANQRGDGLTTQVSYTGPGIVEIVAQNGIAGAGNAGVGVRVPNGATMRATIVPAITGAGGDLALGAATTAFAWDDTAGDYISPKRALTWANVTASVGAGGFGGQPKDVRHESYFDGPDS